MDNYELVRVKFSDFLGLEITYREKVQGEDVEYEIETTKKSGIQRHVDIDNIKDQLKIHVARAFGLLAIGLYRPEEDMNKQEKDILEMILDKIKISGIQISGSDDNRTCMIIATRDMFGKKANLITVPIRLEDDRDYEWHKELSLIVSKIANETYEYLFNRKFAQLELFSVDTIKEKVPNNFVPVTEDLLKKQA